MISEDARAYFLLLRSFIYARPIPFFWSLRLFISSLKPWLNFHTRIYTNAYKNSAFYIDYEDHWQALVVELLSVIQEIDLRKTQRVEDLLYFTIARYDKFLGKTVPDCDY